MPRPTIAQLLTGTLTVVATTVALLAVSGATGVFEIAVLVTFAVVLGTLAVALQQAATRGRPHRTPPAAPASTPPVPEYARR
ncbi:hypothetical protein ABT095_05260 [Kitasatospora sp. NPDC002227]|uniref:hypothetical protein n=1 Tax=Kitasatospora sp. NPDC002227 TaxID=3154773 RepID=UPI00332374C6